jgi:hypothetical protein
MRHADQALRYQRASLITAGAVAALPVLYFAVAFLVLPSMWYREPDVYTGFIALVAASIAAVTSGGLVFPLVADRVKAKARLTATRFVIWNVVALAVLSLAAAGLIAASCLLCQALMTFILAAVLALPFCFLWLRLASLPHNSTPQADALEALSSATGNAARAAGRER